MGHEHLQIGLFETEPTPVTSIPGLSYIPDYIDSAQEEALICHIDNQPWITDLKRRVQHYGYRYDYKARSISHDLTLEALPEWLAAYCHKLYEQGHFAKIPDQVIVNEYQPCQGISPHIDIPAFEEPIASLSLGSPCIMDFTHSKTGEKVPVLLEARSLVLMSGAARNDWKHSIAARKTDHYNGNTFSRTRRLSLTFRKVILTNS